VSEHELIALAKALRYDLTAAQAKLSNLLRMAGELELPDPDRTVCPTCGVTVRGERSLAEHRYHSHDGPVPEHWVEAERKAADPTPPDGPWVGQVER